MKMSLNKPCGIFCIIFGLSFFAIPIIQIKIDNNNFSIRDCFIIDKNIVIPKINWNILDIDNNKTSIIICAYYVDKNTCPKNLDEYKINSIHKCSYYKDKKKYSWNLNSPIFGYILFIVPIFMNIITITGGYVCIKGEQEYNNNIQREIELIILEEEKDYNSINYV